jgi:hypothetical protein
VTIPTATPGARAQHLAVVLASAGRPELLAEVVADLGHQTRQDFILVLSVPTPDSLPPGPLPPGARVVHDRGLAAQRNAGLDAVPEATHVFFFDDDAVPREDFLEQAVRFFDAHPGVVGLTGRVLLDGAVGEAVPLAVARAALDASRAPAPEGTWSPSRELYGCNFAYRRTAAPGERFDARLPLYSWLEDHDFARRLMRHGQLAKVDDCVAVHRGVKSGGRMAHERLGYSQVMNPAHLLRTGSFPWWLALSEAGRRVARNAARSVRSPEREWRRERLLGNARALADLLRGRCTPERILDLPVRGRATPS